MAKILKLDAKTIREWQLFQKAMAPPKRLTGSTGQKQNKGPRKPKE